MKLTLLCYDLMNICKVFLDQESDKETKIESHVKIEIKFIVQEKYNLMPIIWKSGYIM